MRVLFVLFIMCVYSFLWSQDVEKKIIIKKSGDTENVWISDDSDTKVIKKEKSVMVNVEADDNGERTIKIVTDSNGEKKLIEWTDNGEIPADIKEQLEAEGIDIAVLNGDGEHQEIEVIVDNDSDEVIEFEWDGEGEMPAELQKMMEEHDIDLEGYMEGEEKEHKIVMVKKHIKGEGPQMRKKIKKKGNYKMITIDDDGDEKVIEWHGDGEDHDNLFEHKMKKRKLHKGHNEMIFESEGGHKMMFFGDDEEESYLSDAYMGAQIESSEMGVIVLDLMKDSPADKAKLEKGDLIQRINGARTRDMDGLLDLLNYFEPNDKVEVIVLRNGKEKKLNLTLGTRPDHYR